MSKVGVTEPITMGVLVAALLAQEKGLNSRLEVVFWVMKSPSSL